VPLLKEIRSRITTTNPEAIVEARDYQPVLIQGSMGQPWRTIHRLFVTVREKE
jgi:hypothetical protein